MDNYTNLIAMKKTLRKPKDGDMFVLQPVSGMFCFGKVIQASVESDYPVNYKPKYAGPYGLTSYGYVGRVVQDILKGEG